MPVSAAAVLTLAGGPSRQKLGDRIQEALGVSQVAELGGVTLYAAAKHFGPSVASFLTSLPWGGPDEPVKERGPPKSLLCERSFPGVSGERGIAQVVAPLAAQLWPRLVQVGPLAALPAAGRTGLARPSPGPKALPGLARWWQLPAAGQLPICSLRWAVQAAGCAGAGPLAGRAAQQRASRAGCGGACQAAGQAAAVLAPGVHAPQVALCGPAAAAGACPARTPCGCLPDLHAGGRAAGGRCVAGLPSPAPCMMQAGLLPSPLHDCPLCMTVGCC